MRSMFRLFGNEKFIYFVTGLLTAVFGTKIFKHPKTRVVAVNALAKAIKFKNEATEAAVNLKEEAEDIYHDALSESDKGPDKKTDKR